MKPSPIESDLIARLGRHSGRGTFEAHVTIDAPDGDECIRFQNVCDELRVKCVVIELPQGVMRSQPMTSTYHRGELASVIAEVARLARTLVERGFVVSRVKLEAVITNEGVPASDEEARQFPSENYFEFHVKLNLPLDADLDALRILCQQHDAHLSRNALKPDRPDCSPRFVTLRVHGVGRVRAEAQFDQLIRALEQTGYPLGNRLREYTIYDSNAHVDAGWMS